MDLFLVISIVRNIANLSKGFTFGFTVIIFPLEHFANGNDFSNLFEQLTANISVTLLQIQVVSFY